jgi:hypothetical protein
MPEIGKTYRAPKMTYPDPPPVGTVLAPAKPGPFPTVYIVLDAGDDFTEIHESGREGSLSWVDALESTDLIVIGTVPMPPAANEKPES